MATLISNPKYFTEDYYALTDQRKIEELVTQLTRIAMYNDIDGKPVQDTLARVAEMRQFVK